MARKYKFNVGDVISPIEGYSGIIDAKVIGITKETKGPHKRKEMYLLKIINGTATILVSSADACYELKTDK
jgi:hypothetical protein